MKKQIQRIQQLIDKLPNGKRRKELFEKLLKLKLNKKIKYGLGIRNTITLPTR